MASLGSNLSKKQKLTPVQVYLRIRPQNGSEVGSVITDCTPKNIHVKGHSKGYSFDQIFDHKTTQVKVYKTVVGKMITDVTKGYNCTVFAYGQTGSGKTFTIIGGDDLNSVPNKFDWQEESEAGIILRAAMHIFEELNKMDVSLQKTVTVSFMEIYNEELRDLLSEKDMVPLRLYEHKGGVVHIKNLQEMTVVRPEEIVYLLKKGLEKRHVASTLVNHRSSRSHTVFTISVNIIQPLSTAGNLTNIACGKLNLIDLAGSENIAKSGSKDQRAREATNINQSLLTLGRVIKALIENSSHVPYRESKLTRILQDSLGGKTKTAIIATISPCGSSLEETVNTLDYASNARSVTNCPTINVKTSANSAAVHEEINRLKRDLFATANEQGIYMDQENYEEMTQTLTQFRKDIHSKHETITELTEQVEDLLAKQMEWDQLKKSFEITNRAYLQCQKEIEAKEQKEEMASYMLKYYESESTRLQEFADLMRERENRLHQKVDNLYADSFKNQNVIQNILDMIEGSVEKFQQLGSQSSDEMSFNISTLIKFNERVGLMLHNVLEKLQCNAEQYKMQSEDISNYDFDPNNQFSRKINEFVEFIAEFNSHLEETSKRAIDRIEQINQMLKLKEEEDRKKSESIMENFQNKAIQQLTDKEMQLKEIYEAEDMELRDFFKDCSKMMEREHQTFKKHIVLKMHHEYQRFEEKRRVERKSSVFDFSDIKNEIENASKKAMEDLNKISTEARLKLEEEKNIQCPHEILNSMQSKGLQIVKGLLESVFSENQEMASVIQEISNILNINGKALIKQMERTVENHSRSTIGMTRKMTDNIKEFIGSSVVPVAHVGDTPRRMEHSPQKIQARGTLMRQLLSSKESENIEEVSEDD